MYDFDAGPEVPCITTTAEKLERWQREIEHELAGLEFFESMGQYMYTKQSSETHRKMVAENAGYRPVLEAMLAAIESKGGKS